MKIATTMYRDMDMRFSLELEQAEAGMKPTQMSDGPNTQ